MGSRKQKRIRAGMMLIVLGVILYAIKEFQGLGETTVLVVIGVIFLAGYLRRKSYGLLVPAGILLGMSAGMILEDSIPWVDHSVLFGMGSGFVAIYLIPLIYQGRTHLWPLIPGAAMILISLPNGERIFEYFAENWPLILVIIGVLMLLGAFGRPAARSLDSSE
jgi:hypothetical protein